MNDNKPNDARSTHADLTIDELTTAVEIATAEVAEAISHNDGLQEQVEATREQIDAGKRLLAGTELDADFIQELATRLVQLGFDLANRITRSNENTKRVRAGGKDLEVLLDEQTRRKHQVDSHRAAVEEMAERLLDEPIGGNFAIDNLADGEVERMKRFPFLIPSHARYIETVYSFDGMGYRIETYNESPAGDEDGSTTAQLFRICVRLADGSDAVRGGFKHKTTARRHVLRVVRAGFILSKTWFTGDGHRQVECGSVGPVGPRK